MKNVEASEPHPVDFDNLLSMACASDEEDLVARLFFESVLQRCICRIPASYDTSPISVDSVAVV